jgi:hypothetical protein
LFCVLFGGLKHSKIVERSVIVALIGMVTLGLADERLRMSDKQLQAIHQQHIEQSEGDDPHGG